MNNLKCKHNENPFKARKEPVKRSIFEAGTYNHNFLRGEDFRVGNDERRFKINVTTNRKRAAGVESFGSEILENKPSSFLKWSEVKPTSNSRNAKVLSSVETS